MEHKGLHRERALERMNKGLDMSLVEVRDQTVHSCVQGEFQEALK